MVYEGCMLDGMFHGEGVLTYPMGQIMDAIWDHGKMVSYKFCNVDGLDYNFPWSYCKMPDRRHVFCKCSSAIVIKIILDFMFQSGKDCNQRQKNSEPTNNQPGLSNLDVMILVMVSSILWPSRSIWNAIQKIMSKWILSIRSVGAPRHGVLLERRSVH